MLLAPSHAWTRRQKRLMVGLAVSALALFGALIYGYERYYRGPRENVFYGTWLDPLLPNDAQSYWEFRSDHTFAILTVIDGKKETEVEGRWYAGGPNIYLRFPSEYLGPTRPIVMRIIDISPDRFSVRLPTGVYHFQRATLESPRTSSQSMERTATRFGPTFCVANTFSLRPTCALGGRRSSYSR